MTFLFAEEAFRLAGFITTFRIGGAIDVDFTEKLEVSYQVFKGLSLVARSKEQQELYKHKKIGDSERTDIFPALWIHDL